MGKGISRTSYRGLALIPKSYGLDEARRLLRKKEA